MADYLHNHKDFPELLRIVGDELKILPGLVEKDYWIMHVLYGLQQQQFNFELKGGTSLSKGYKIIKRFSEDIEIHITPPAALNVEEDYKKNKPAHIESRRLFYDWLTKEIKINGIIAAERDTAFDSKTFTSGGIRLFYKNNAEQVEGLKEGILLEAGFDIVTPNKKLTISSWAYDKAIQSSDVIDNRAIDVVCYHPGYTFVEKLQTIINKFRQEQADEKERPNLMRQYYDVASLLNNKEVQDFIGTAEYKAHKEKRIRGKDAEIPIPENQAFLLTEAGLLDAFRERYKKTKTLYYKGQPDFDNLIATIQAYLPKL
jgi:hypothetical protein